MSDNTPQPPSLRPSPQGPAPDPLQTLLLVLVTVLVLGATGYVCVAHPALTAPIAAVGGIGAALATAIGIALGNRRH
ncbi:hypothetical protein Snoj_00250 [Streptomyces nojiriensis]|uniref:Uncharacterized protein n=1 Tax=Streptomyces nojiriensis TaxID=66374 RepID=A0ABQ3SDU3_9ACTN|nr:hypothetical protein [Streptomyces nojiriensis]GGS39298.1 hypothetical protein GCM10010205_81290 [Streptomyces nojiriensis]GHI66107.1 hypothetical protein Snoj_00250 [Streptomyces nojiriensis]